MGFDLEYLCEEERYMKEGTVIYMYIYTHIILHEKYDSLPDRRNAIKAPHIESKSKKPIFMNIHNTL